MITKGKWKIMETTYSSWHIYTGEEGNEVVLAAVRNQDFKSNARLIAASKDLLEACKFTLEQAGISIDSPSHKKLTQAIAKAENN